MVLITSEPTEISFFFIAEVGLEVVPDASSDLTLLNDGTYTFYDETVTELTRPLLTAIDDEDDTEPDVECFIIQLIPLDVTDPHAADNTVVTRAQVCVLNKPSKNRFNYIHV